MSESVIVITVDDWTRLMTHVEAVCEESLKTKDDHTVAMQVAMMDLRDTLWHLSDVVEVEERDD